MVRLAGHWVPESACFHPYQALGLQTPNFYVGTVIPNSGPYATLASTLTTEPLLRKFREIWTSLNLGMCVWEVLLQPKKTDCIEAVSELTGVLQEAFISSPDFFMQLWGFKCTFQGFLESLFRDFIWDLEVGYCQCGWSSWSGVLSVWLKQKKIESMWLGKKTERTRRHIRLCREVCGSDKSV